MTGRTAQTTTFLYKPAQFFLHALDNLGAQCPTAPALAVDKMMKSPPKANLARNAKNKARLAAPVGVVTAHRLDRMAGGW